MSHNYEDKIPSPEECEKILSTQPGLSKQSFETLSNLKELSPFTPEIMSRQATLNIGTIGHVAHGKTSLVRAITGIQTTKHKIEKQRNITYKLGYANAKLYKCSKCPEPDCYQSYGSEHSDNSVCEKCGSPLELIRHVSFVDCPGHDILMSTMLNGAAVMDAALLVIAANEKCPQPQTSEHLAAVENLDLENIIVIQNKIDIALKDDSCKVHYDQIKEFIAKSRAANSPVIPISAQLKFNVDVVIQYLCNLPIPKRDFQSPPRFIIVRSFDVNHPGFEANELQGGVAGGTLMRGVLKLGQVVEIRPGIVKKKANGETEVLPLYSRIESLKTENNSLIYVVPGGLIGVGLGLDPYLAKQNGLEGKILGLPGKLPNIYSKVICKIHLLSRVLGVKARQGIKTVEHIAKIRNQEVLSLNLGGTNMAARVVQIDNNDEITFDLGGDRVCCEIGEKVALSRKIGNNWRLIGWGKILPATQGDNE